MKKEYIDAILRDVRGIQAVTKELKGKIDSLDKEDILMHLDYINDSAINVNLTISRYEVSKCMRNFSASDIEKACDFALKETGNSTKDQP